ncbi:MAG: glycosyl transferase family 2 [Deltaproteobacteria bacterium RBG_13_61_14]|nr:MAG: glycosyl transferase family 2 [Deltaproteobacteria bacterium RBG_13_61_14]
MAAKISVIVPVKDEARSLAELHQRVVEALERIGQPFEIILVDDGSADDSFQEMQALFEKDPRVRVVKLLRNFGKSAALAAGFDRAEGEVVVTLDADLQDDPKEIPQFLAKLEEGYHLVSGWKKHRRDPFSRRALSRLFNFATARLSGVEIHDFNCGFKAYRREALSRLRLYGELHRYIPALLGAQGFRVTEIEVLHHPRRFGQSKYGLGRIPRGLFDLLTVLFLTQYARRPLHLFGGVGLLSFLLGSACLGYMTVLWFLGHRPIGTRPLFLGGIMLLLLGAQILSLGLIGELVTHLAHRGEAPYLVQVELKRS